MSLIVNRRDLDFLLFELLELESLKAYPRFASMDRDVVSEVLDTAQSIAEAKFLPIAGTLDAQEPRLDDGKISIMAEVGEALSAFAEAGFLAAAFDEAAGGLQLPYTVATAANGMFACANTAVFNYAFLTMAAANLINAVGSQEQRDLYLPRMLAGTWFGTMCLSEPQAGSSLADIRTRAEPGADGAYRIVGNKMWISGGDHELAENIIHMVLAKVPGGPPGVKGISLFLVPRYLMDAGGTRGAWNNISLAGLNHKMGQRGTTNCLLNFGENGETRGYLVGDLHQGLRYMFNMMNEARLGVGHAAVMAALGGYRYSLEYARSRCQGRRIQDKNPASPQVPLIEHVDVRRMLLAQKAAVEGALGLVLVCARLVDERNATDNPTIRSECALLLDILTPVAKSWPSEYCLEANKLAIQILGGYGYTRDYPVERLYRDNRLNHIHEGAYAIQAIDLLGRKVRMENGAAYALLRAKIDETLLAASTSEGLTQEVVALRAALAALDNTTATVIACKDIELALANATPYLEAFGHVVIAWIWLRQAMAAHRGLADANAETERAFYEGKLSACRYFFRYELPAVHVKLTLVRALDATCRSMTDMQFA
jgi:butyryl-CoA dehydrogenase